MKKLFTIAFCAVTGIANCATAVVPTAPQQTVTDDKTIKAPDGTTIEMKSDGSKVIHSSDGTVIQKNADGSSVVTETDGVVVEVKADGSKTIKKPDGTVINIAPGK